MLIVEEWEAWSLSLFVAQAAHLNENIRCLIAIQIFYALFSLCRLWKWARVSFLSCFSRHHNLIRVQIVLYIVCVCVRVCWTHYIKLLLNRKHMQYAQEHSQRYLCHASPLSIYCMHCYDWHRRTNVVERTSKGLTQLIGICGEMLLVHFNSHEWGKKTVTIRILLYNTTASSDTESGQN